MSVGLDFDTFGTRNLKVVGLDNYINDPEFRVLIASAHHGTHVQHWDFVTNRDERRKLNIQEHEAMLEAFRDYAASLPFVAHNASFERAVIERCNLGNPRLVVSDSAVISRALGAGEKLEHAAPQLLGVDKMPDGARLIQKFSVPQKDGYVYIDHVEDWTDEDWADWDLFGKYCNLDAELSFRINLHWGGYIPFTEWEYERRTQAMNDVGWPVDADLIHRMIEQRDKNLARIEQEFRLTMGADDLNFRSTPQLRAWCRERGVNAQSFDEIHVEQLLKRINSRIEKLYVTGSQAPRIQQQLSNYTNVRYMLRVKQELGGTSLSKLDTILRLMNEDGRLRGQYMHVGAGQTFRASGRGAQLQNLKKLGKVPGDVDGSLDGWDNGELARNLRQVFLASHTDGQIIVADLKSVESRGLAYIANAEWKLKAFHEGKDMYLVQAASMFGIPYELVSPEQRTPGKVGELSCGYGAGDGAIARFAEKMHIAMTEAEAGEVKTKWRDSNPEAVELWRMLDDALHDVVERKHENAVFRVGPDHEWFVILQQEPTPKSLREQMPEAQTMSMSLRDARGNTILKRWFQGCYMDGRDVCYHKPSDLKGGKLWVDIWHKDGKSGRYKLYGGKLTGILIQSFCREIFYRGLDLLYGFFADYSNVRIIGQFHDEIVVEWWPTPNGLSLDAAMGLMRSAMGNTRLVPGFPLEADVHAAPRYIK